MIRNPVLRGFNPDPSITRVGEDYFLATSTLVWQPGIRLFHSTDLASWALIGHGLKTGEHDLRGLASHQGIWAPCLTFSRAEGLFYLTYSLVRSTTADYFDVDNFLVTAPDVRGPWSRPAYLNSIGFDPSFFHDDDGRHWLLTLEWDPREGYEHPGAIVLEEFDAEHLISGARVANPSSRNILEKCGFQWSGVELHRFEALGSSTPVDRFRLSRSVWSSLKHWGSSTRR